ncbi:MAG: DNA mismatch repair protein MutL, partial [Spirochaetales bacterium]|nr:DNA mismatch repair protein MutL [Spirochaetales bacterium]
NQRNLREIMRIALANPGVSFDYFREGKSHISVVAAEDLRTRICQLWPGKPGQHLVRVQAQSGGLQLSGFITDEHFYRANREGQYSFVNGRPVDVKHLSYLVRKAYGEILPPGAHPYYFLFLEVDRTRVDVNVHPAKQEVRLLDQPALHGLVLEAIHKALRPVTPLSMPGIAGEGGHSGPRFQHSLTAVEEVLLGAPLPLRAAVDINPSGSSPGAPESFSNREDQMAFLPDRHFGVFFGTYILAESADALFLIDQHTAHERINYEKQRRNLEGQAGKRQALLHPIAIDCLPDELEQVLNHEQALAESGFLVEAFGPRSYIVREVPPYLEPGAEEEAILHLIHRTLEGERGVRLYDEYAAMKACKGSIKRNDRVDDSVLSSIIRELSQCENPSRCPHGRPTMYRISRAELDRWFHRA